MKRFQSIKHKKVWNTKKYETQKIIEHKKDILDGTFAAPRNFTHIPIFVSLKKHVKFVS